MQNYEHVKRNFGPVYDGNSKIIILGSFPSVKSREAAFYYGHPRNRFWPLVSRILGEEIPEDVSGRRALALRHGIALWDVLEECDIHRSSDSSIRNPVPVDISLITDSCSIRAIFCNGETSYKLYRKHLEPVTGMEAVKLPSTSPANAVAGIAELEGKWRAILPFLIS